MACLHFGLEPRSTSVCLQNRPLLPGKIKAEADNLSRELAIIAHNGHFARIIRDLLIHIHLPVPVERLIEERDNL